MIYLQYEGGTVAQWFHFDIGIYSEDSFTSYKYILRIKVHKGFLKISHEVPPTHIKSHSLTIKLH